MNKQAAMSGAQPVKHSKEALLASKHFTAVEKDMMRGLLRDDETYTVKEAVNIFEKNLKREAQ
ncbi:hypothetical protein [Cohnella phaseoli]|uniref:Uncharacterized protein n=1 Tax=Cohnella phaseoli TaxID=456490 RepID=A0A3D9IV06_9BACL|nr:hypothetical protein [Cohnella phaseoli]RED65477.1 hypothetical protein DFP98_119117 [Cohnella phaseoli]